MSSNVFITKLTSSSNTGSQKFAVVSILSPANSLLLDAKLLLPNMVYFLDGGKIIINTSPQTIINSNIKSTTSTTLINPIQSNTGVTNYWLGSDKLFLLYRQSSGIYQILYDPANGPFNSALTSSEFTSSYCSTISNSDPACSKPFMPNPTTNPSVTNSVTSSPTVTNSATSNPIPTIPLITNSPSSPAASTSSTTVAIGIGLAAIIVGLGIFLVKKK